MHRKHTWSKDNISLTIKAKENFFVHLVGLERCSLLWVPFRSKTINFTKYCDQLDKLKIAIAKKRLELVNRRGVIFHHDKTAYYIGCKRKTVTIDWDILPHPSYSPKPCSIRLLFVRIIKKLSPWYTVPIRKQNKNAFRGIFCKL